MKTIRLTKLLKQLLIVVLLVPFNNCSLFETVTPEEDVVEKTISSDGGTIENQTVEIVIPAGAFNEPHTIEVSKSDPQSTNFGADEASAFYKISGIPLNIDAPIQIKIEPEGGNLDQMLGIVGETVYVKSLNGEQLVYRFHEGVITGNQYQMVLEPEPENQQKNNATIDITVGLVQNHQVLLVSPANKSNDKQQADQILFEIVVNEEFVAQATLLGDYLLEAYNKIQNQLGFDYSTRTKWPVKVDVSDLGSEAYGYYNPSKWSTNWGTLSLNQQKINDLAMMRVTIGHEFFHLVQAFYDPRYTYTKATSAGPWWWVDEASATWIEEKFNESPDYCPPIWADNKLTSMTGLLEAETGSTLGQHGYGMAAFIKFIEKNYGIDKIRSLYEYYWNFQSNPLEAFNAVLNSNTSTYYPEYVKQYVLSQLYKDFTYKDFSTDWNHVVRNEADYNKTLKINYPALSTRLLAVKFQDTGLTANSFMEIEQKSNSGSTTMLLFKTLNDVTSFVAQNPNKITLNNLQEIQQENAKLWLFIVNYQNQPLTDEEHVFSILKEEIGQHCPGIQNFTDSRDGQTYNTVLIGNQCWMKENLKFLPYVSRPFTFSYTESHYYVYGYDSTYVNDAKSHENFQYYGVLYNWPAAISACPSGWHLPNDAEWITLEGTVDSLYDINHWVWPAISLRGYDVGQNLKATISWNNEGNGSDKYGFTALAGGIQFYGNFSGLGNKSSWWSSTEHWDLYAYARSFISNSSKSSRTHDAKREGYYVRCLKDY